jgi:hypothetical protein
VLVLLFCAGAGIGAALPSGQAPAAPAGLVDGRAQSRQPPGRPAPTRVPDACARLAAPAWCADLPPERVQQQLPAETAGRAYGP